MKFVDLNTQFEVLETDIRAAIDRVLDHCQFIMGPEVGELESLLCDYTKAKHTICCSSGTDALLMSLMAWGVKPGDAVFTTPFTFIATAEMAQLLGATVVFVDVDEKNFNIDPESLARSIEDVKKQGDLKPKVIIPVDLFGLPADYDAIQELADKHNLKVLADGCQGFGGRYKGKAVGLLGDVTVTSFFPAKTLGAYGDGGAVFTDDDELEELIRSIRIHGMGKSQYENVRTGITGRIDTFQAAILICKLKVFDEELKARQRIADTYSKALKDYVHIPVVEAGYQSAWAQYTIRSDRREEIRQHLQKHDVPAVVYYPLPLHRQKVFAQARTINELPVSERLSDTVLSIPIHPYLQPAEQSRIIELIIEVMDS